MTQKIYVNLMNLNLLFIEEYYYSFDNFKTKLDMLETIFNSFLEDQ